MTGERCLLVDLWEHLKDLLVVIAANLNGAVLCWCWRVRCCRTDRSVVFVGQDTNSRLACISHLLGTSTVLVMLWDAHGLDPFVEAV